MARETYGWMRGEGREVVAVSSLQAVLAINPEDVGKHALVSYLFRDCL